jgi:hypothetical protein
VDTSGYKNAIEKYNPGDPKFNMGQLSDSINGAKTSAGAVPVQAYQYQDPAQFQKLLTQMNSVLQPLTDAQKANATSSYNSQAQKLGDQWAARGLLASGAAASQQMQGAQGLTQQLATMDAQQQANAIPLAQQFAQLALQEDSQKFNQQANNRDFTAQQAQNNVGNLMSALGLQNTQQQQYIGNLGNLANMDINQNQWAQNFGLQKQQFEAGNALDWANLINNQNQFNANSTNNTNQFNANLNNNQQQFNAGALNDAARFNSSQGQANSQFNAGQANNMNQFNAQQAQNQNQFNANNTLDWSKLLQNQNQFNATNQLDRDRLNQQQSQFDTTTAMQKQLNNWNAYKDNVAMTGNLGTGPKTDWGLLNSNPNQMAANQQTAQAQLMMDYLKNVGVNPNNLGSLFSGMNNYGNLSNLLNQYSGQPTIQGQEMNYKNKQLDAQINQWAASNGLSSEAHQLQRESQQQTKNYQGWLQQRGMTEDQGKQATQGIITNLLGMESKDKAIQYIVENQKEITDDGANVQELLKAIDTKWGTYAQNNKPQSGGGNIFDQALK